MIAFWTIGLLLIALALAFAVPPLLRPAEAGPDQQGVSEARTATYPNPRIAALAVVVLLPLLSIGLYFKLGDFRVFDPTVQSVTAAMQQAQESGLSPLEQAIAGLKERLAQHPEDLEGWMLLGRAYKTTEQFELARDALASAQNLAPDNPIVLVEYAEALALSSPDRRFAGEPQTFLERALSIDPDNQRALWMLGVAHYQSGNIEETIATWTHLASVMPEDNPARNSVLQRVQELSEQGHLLLGDSTGKQTETSTAGAAPRLQIHVSLSPELAERAKPDDTVFVFARAVQGSRAPLAIQTFKVSQLPLSVTLDDSHAMVPQMNLSSVREVLVGARISQSGNAQAQPGDLETLSSPLPVTFSDDINLVIDQVFQ